jgi:broad specificity phosphatase PhoE
MEQLMSDHTFDERATIKYQSALDLAVTLEQSQRCPRKRSELSEWQPSELYRYLYEEWWHEWNGLLQRWEPNY